MTKIVVLGCGLVGSAIAYNLSQDSNFEVVSADISQQNLDRLKKYPKIKTLLADLSSEKELRKLVADYDVVVGALPGFMGFKTLKTLIEAGKNVVDISFFPEDAMELDQLAKKMNVTAIVDCGVAPGCSNLVLGYVCGLLDSVSSFTCYVGGLPVVREWPFEYKAPFSPIDVIEEYVRPARYRESGQMVVKPALSDPELMNFSGIGTLEVFNTDGLRSLLKNFPDVPNMVEKTMRYIGHIDKIRLLRELGFFSYEPVELKGGLKIRPIDLTTTLIFPRWKLKDGEADLTIMQIRVTGKKGNKTMTYQYDLLDHYDATNNILSMARTTGFTCASAVRLLVQGKYTKKGISPPEFIGKDPKCFKFMMEELKKHNVIYHESILEQ